MKALVVGKSVLNGRSLEVLERRETGAILRDPDSGRGIWFEAREIRYSDELPKVKNVDESASAPLQSCRSERQRADK